jgi:hypothetical protein
MVIGCAGHAKQPQVAWPVPSGWRTETIAFPLDFAPSIAYHGEEQIRFAPGMFNAAAPDYFSYVFVWIVDEQPALTADALTA